MDSLSVSLSNQSPSNRTPSPSLLQIQEEEGSEATFETSKGRKRTAISTWEHTRSPKDNESEFAGKTRIFYCKYCENPPYRCQSSSAFRNHLKGKHDIDVQPKQPQVQASALSKLQEMYSKAGCSNTVSEFDAQILKSVLNKSVIDKALTALIVQHNLPFRLVEAPAFHAFCQSINPQINREITSSHSEISRKISQMWTSEKDIVRKKLQSSLTKIHISLDIWTSPNKILFLGVCGHFVEYETERLFKALLGLCPVGGHSSQDQFDVLIPLLDDYGITGKLGCIMGDNHSANDKLCNLVARFFEENMVWDPVHHRMRCNGHIINLAVQAFLFGEPSWGENEDGDWDENGDEDKDRNNSDVQGTAPLKKLHNIVVHARGSTSRYHEFKALAGRMIPLDNATRWISWYVMLNVALEKEDAIDRYTKKWYADLEINFLTPEDWTKLRAIAEFLSPFYRATLDSEGDNSTIDCALPNMDILVKHFEKSLVS